jgi:hypothetical protein
MSTTLYATTPEQVVNDLETAMTEFVTAKGVAEKELAAFEEQLGMESAGKVARAMTKLEEAAEKLSNVVALLNADMKRAKTEVGILKRQCKRLDID